jgi:exopolyphosphatase/guanosine-5'-triphosphate,3'-diphosphate pyrophosphatase
VRHGLTLPLGGLALQDITGKSLKKAEKLVEDAFDDLDILEEGEGRTFYAVGGTWRSLARLHMWQTGYPFHVMHNYRISAREALEFSRLVHRVDTETLSKIEVINAARRPLLSYAALVMENLVRLIKPKEVVISVLGVREGLLYSLLDARERARDPLLSAASDLNVLRSRSPGHGQELGAWTDRFIASSGLEESAEERRLRHAACLLADIGWRAHPDYRGEQAMNIIAHGPFVSIDHPSRAYLALSVFLRHAGLNEEELPTQLRELTTPHILDRARVLGAAMRVAYILTAGQSGVLEKVPMQVKRGKLVLTLPGKYSKLASDRIFSRLRQLARLVGREPVIEV